LKRQIIATKYNSDTKQNKGSILKASVDYIIKVKSEFEETKKIQERILALNKMLYSRIKVFILIIGQLSILKN
jgi:hypothetical protein